MNYIDSSQFLEFGAGCFHQLESKKDMVHANRKQNGEKPQRACPVPQGRGAQILAEIQ
jgi:hypothetical protein